ncbi:MAG: sigma-70 family RNA polymerase sigma factor [Polyangiaceae bacterium]
MSASPETTTLPSVLGETYLEHHDRLYRAAYRVVGNATDAEDVVQTVFLRLAQREPLGWGAENLAGYLYRAAINTALDLLRARRERPIASMEQLEQHQPSDAMDSEQDHALRSRLREALSRLSPRWAEMFVLKHIEGCENTEIARLCGTSQAVVAVTLFRARARLKRELTLPIGGAP